MWAMALSPAQWDELNWDLGGMDPKTGKAFLRLCGYLRRFGTVPTGERAFASALGVTVGFLRKTAWPLLEARLDISPDGQRYFIPEIIGARSQRTPAPTPEKSPRHVKAANSRWHQDASNSDASMHEERMQPDAKPDAKSTADASEMHATVHVFASDRAPSLSVLLASSVSSQPTVGSVKSEEEIEREKEIARARADAPGMQLSMQNDAN